MSLSIAKGSKAYGRYIVQCKRGILVKKTINNRLTELSIGVGIANHARPKNIRRTKGNERRTGTRVQKNMTSTRQPTAVNHCCKMHFTVRVNIDNNCYYIASGCGYPYHNNHPKINMVEAVNCSGVAAEDIAVLRNQLYDGNAPTPVMRQVLTLQSGQLLPRGFYRNNEPNSITNFGTSADRLLAYLSSTDDIKYVALFDNVSRRNLHTVRRRPTRTDGTTMMIEGSVRNYDGRISTFEVTEDD